MVYLKTPNFLVQRNVTCPDYSLNPRPSVTLELELLHQMLFITEHYRLQNKFGVSRSLFSFKNLKLYSEGTKRQGELFGRS